MNVLNTDETIFAYIDPETGEERHYPICDDLIPPNSYLDLLRRWESSEEGIVYTDDPNINIVRDYLYTRPIINDQETIDYFIYQGVYRDYDAIWRDEVLMREKIRDENYGGYGAIIEDLISLTDMRNFQQEFVQYQETYTPPKGLLFPRQQELRMISYEDVKMKLDGLQFLFKVATDFNIEIIVVDEYVFRLIFGIETSLITYPTMSNNINKMRGGEINIDVLFVNTDTESIDKYITNVADVLQNWIGDRVMTIARYPRMISLSMGGSPYNRAISINFAMISYKTKSEAIHSNPFDCCCVGYDGETILATERARYALFNGYNTVNFDLMCENYERLLTKYAMLGMSIKVPNIEDYIIDYSAINIIGLSSGEKESTLSIVRRLAFLHEKGLIDNVKETLFNLSYLFRLPERTPNAQLFPDTTGLDLLVDLDFVLLYDDMISILDISGLGVPHTSIGVFQIPPIYIPFNTDTMTLLSIERRGKPISSILKFMKLSRDQYEAFQRRINLHDMEMMLEDATIIPSTEYDIIASVYPKVVVNEQEWYLGKYVNKRNDPLM